MARIVWRFVRFQLTNQNTYLAASEDIRAALPTRASTPLPAVARQP